MSMTSFVLVTPNMVTLSILGYEILDFGYVLVTPMTIWFSFGYALICGYVLVTCW